MVDRPIGRLIGGDGARVRVRYSSLEMGRGASWGPHRPPRTCRGYDRAVQAARGRIVAKDSPTGCALRSARQTSS